MYHLCELLYTHAFRAIIKLLVFGVGEDGGCCVVLAVLGHFALEESRLGFRVFCVENGNLGEGGRWSEESCKRGGSHE